MKKFHSYVPVECEEHFCIPRKDLIDHCVTQLIGHPEKGGYFFTNKICQQVMNHPRKTVPYSVGAGFKPAPTPCKQGGTNLKSGVVACFNG